MVVRKLLLVLLVVLAVKVTGRVEGVEVIGGAFQSNIVDFDSATYEIDQYWVETDETLYLMEGYACPNLPNALGECPSNCRDACDYANINACGTLNPNSTAVCNDGSFQCQTTAGLLDERWCASEWSELQANQWTSTQHLVGGFQRTYRIFLRDLCRGVSLKIQTSSGDLIVYASRSTPTPNYNNNDWKLIAKPGAAQLTICPTDKGWVSGEGGGTMVFTVWAVEDSYFQLFVDAEVAPLPEGAAPACDAEFLEPEHKCLGDSLTSICRNDDGIADFCEYFMFTSPLTESCGPVLLFATKSNRTAPIRLYLSKTEQFPSHQNADIVSTDLSEVISMCPGESLFIAISDFRGEDDDFEMRITATTAGKLTSFPIVAGSMYDVGTKLLLNSLVLDCRPPGAIGIGEPGLDNLELEESIFKCYAYDEMECPFFIPTYPMQAPLPWPPVPMFSNDVGYWGHQARNVRSQLFNATANNNPRRFLWYSWQSANIKGTNYPIPDPRINFTTCEWRFTDKVVNAEFQPLRYSFKAAPWYSGSNHSLLEVVEPECSDALLRDVAGDVQRVLFLMLSEMTETTLRALNYLADILRWQDGWSACLNGLREEIFDVCVEIDEYFGTDCFLPENSPGWKADPCCNWHASLYSCCADRNVNGTFIELTPNDTEIAQVCAASVECIRSFAQDLVQRTFESKHSQYGCSAIASAGEAERQAQLIQLSACSVQAFEADQREGWLCETDADCPGGFPCGILTGRCQVPRSWMERTFVECLFGPESPLSLFVLENIKLTYNLTVTGFRNDDFVDAVLAAFQAPSCVTENELGLPFRDHWSWVKPLSSCFDFCFDDEAPDQCVERSCLRDRLCVEPWTTCDRHWWREQIPQEACEDNLGCNWIEDEDCRLLGYESCERECLNNNVFGTHFCAVCEDEYTCIDVGVEDESTCQALAACVNSEGDGYIIDAGETCDGDTLGSCNIECPGQGCTSFADAGGDWDGICYAEVTHDGEPIGPNNCEEEFAGLFAEWTFGTCLLHDIDNREICLQHGFTWEQCDGLSPPQCEACENNDLDNCPVRNRLLNCHVTTTQPCRSRTECEAVGWCSNSEYLLNHETTPPSPGACVLPWISGLFDPDQRCQPGLYPSLVGCVDYGVTQAECVQDLEGQWMTPSTNEEDCLSFGSSCIEFTTGFTAKNSSECIACSGLNDTAETWEAGKWSGTSRLDFLWTPRAVVRKYQYQPALDVNAVAAAVESAVGVELAYSGRSAKMCALFPIQSLLTTLSCSCSPDGDRNDGCFSDTDELPSGVGKPCPLQNYTLVAPPAFFSFGVDSLQLASGVTSISQICPDVVVTAVSALRYRITQVTTLSSLFTRQRKLKDYRVANDDNVEVGQVFGDGVLIRTVEFVSSTETSSLAAGSDIVLNEEEEPDSGFEETDEEDGFSNQPPVNTTDPTPPDSSTQLRVTYRLMPDGSIEREEKLVPRDHNLNHTLEDENFLASNVVLCMQLRADIIVDEPPREASYVIPDFAEDKGGRLTPLGLTATNETEDDVTLFCATLPTLSYEDSFFPILREGNFEGAENDPLFEDWELGLIYTTAALYFFVLAICMLRLGQLVWLGQATSNQAIFPLFLAIFNIFRGVYFVLLGTEVLEGVSTYVNFVLVDLPYFFYFIGMTLLLWWWVSLAWTEDRANLQRNFRILTIGSSLIIAILLGIVMGLYAVLEEDPSTSCGGRVQDEEADLTKQEILVIVYKTILCVLTLAGCTGFLISGAKLRKMALHRVEKAITMITVIAFLSFLGQSIYFIILAATNFSDNIYSLLPLWVIEIIPQLCMLYLQRPVGQRLLGRGRKDSSGSRSRGRRSRGTTSTDSTSQLDDTSGASVGTGPSDSSATPSRFFSGNLYDGSEMSSVVV